MRLCDLAHLPDMRCDNKLVHLKMLVSAGLNVPPIQVLLGPPDWNSVRDQVESCPHPYWFVRVAGAAGGRYRGGNAATADLPRVLEEVYRHNACQDAAFVLFLQPIISSFIAGVFVRTASQLLVEYSYGHFNCRAGHDCTFEVFGSDGRLLKRVIGTQKQVVSFNSSTGTFDATQNHRRVEPPTALRQSLVGASQRLPQGMLVEFVYDGSTVHYVDAKTTRRSWDYHVEPDAFGTGTREGAIAFCSSEITEVANGSICMASTTHYGLVFHLEKACGFVFTGGGRMSHAVTYAVAWGLPVMFIDISRARMEDIRRARQVSVDYDAGSIRLLDGNLVYPVR
jgi:phosphohistidine swiveling domain-containing protein